MNLRALRWSRRSTIVAAIVAATVVGGGVAYAATAQPAIKTFTPRYADQVTNVDVLRQQIRNYYGDPLGTGTFAPDGNYAKETSRVAAEGSHWLKAMHAKKGMTKAIVLDVDDTTLTTWNYELASNWAYNPTTNAQYVTGQLFPATPGMVDMVKRAAGRGLRDLLHHGPARRAGGRDARQPHRGRHRRRRRLPEADQAQGRRGRPVHQAGGGRLPAVPQGRLRERPQRLVHDDPLQVRHAGAHRVAGIRHRRRLRRPVQRPHRRLRRPDVQAAEPELLPAVSR